MLAMSLKTRFSLTIATICVVLGGITFIAIHLSTENIINSLGTQFARKQALLEKSKLMAQVQQDLSLSLKMASSPLINQWVLDEGNQYLKQQAMAELESYRQSFAGKSLFIAIAGSGNYYFTDGSDADHTIPRYTLSAENINDAWFFRAMSEVEDFELNIDYDNHLDLNKIWYNVAIRNQHHEKIGLGGSGVDITSFINQVIDIDEPGIETILFSSDGTIEGHRDRHYVIHNSKVRGKEKKFTIFDLIDLDSDKAIAQAAIDRLDRSESEVENLVLALHGRSYLAAISYMPEIQWYNLVLIDAAQVIGNRNFIPIVAISIASLLIIVVIIVVLLNRLVLTRLSALAVSSNRIAAGNFNIAVRDEAKDEIGVLTSAFNEMALMVKDHNENLEQKVVQRTEELEQANSQLAESNRQIMASIRYAELIQTTILPAEETVRRHIPDFFSFFLPRDIVGGDFYFFRPLESGWLLAVIDCTGHGVPGAFMTMTANAVLSSIIDGGNIDDPAAIIEALNDQFHATLHRNNSKNIVDYGLDIGLCRYENREKVLIYSGARIDLHYVVAGEVQTVDSQRKSIGYRRKGRQLPFVNHAVPIAGEMHFFLTSDGILDQAGGDRGWGFGRRRFMDLIGSLSALPAAARKEKMQLQLATYQQDYTQRDDITVIGFQLGGGTFS